ncbi:MAG: C25 family cysteine peptidase [bacterium]
MNAPRRCRLLAPLVLLACALALPAQAAERPARHPADAVRVFIGFRQRPGKAEQALVRNAGGSIRYTYHIVPAIAATLPQAAVDALKKHPRITHVELEGQFRALDAELDSSWGVKRIGAGSVHASGNKGAGVNVAVVDSGIDYTHPDLDASLWTNPDEVPDNGVDDDGNGYVDDVHGYDFVNDDGDPMDDEGHGTHVSGIVAAEDNDTGVVGVAPAAKLAALKVLAADGYGSWGDLILALEWCTDNGMQVVNMSLGDDADPGTTVAQACQAASDAGLLLVAAAGNSGNPGGGGDTVEWPARYDCVIAVGATDANDDRYRNSSTGPALELAAPGVSVNSTLWGGGYGNKTGTSMASPHVAGVAALVCSAYPTWPDTLVRTVLRDTAEDLGDAGWDSKFGHGLVNASGAAEAGGPPDQRPVANDDDASTPEGTPITIDVLANDSDPNSDPLTVSSLTQPDHGTATLNTDQTVTYAPDAGYTGTDSFTYTAYDGTWHSDAATVTVTVNPVNDPPVANDDAYAVDEDSELTVTAPGVLANDTDADDDPLTAILVSDVSHGTLTLNADGSFTYAPADGFNGDDSFTYKAYDGTAYSNEATVSIAVHAVIDVAEVTIAEPGTSVAKYEKIELLVTLSGGSWSKPYEPDPAYGGLDLTATFTSPSSAEWTVHGFYDGSDWRVRFAPDEVGTWSFQVTATDSSGSDTWTGGAFTCEDSSHKGWARIDGHYLRFSEGQVVFAVGHNNGWQYGDPGDVEQPSFADMAAKGENLLSFWLATPWAEPDWASDTEPWWDDRAPIENVDQGIGNYNQAACTYLDGLVERAEAAGVCLLPTIWSHGQLRTDGHSWGEGWWDNNAYSTVCAAADFFDTSSTEQWRLQKNFYRYLIARWGYSRALAGWVGLCEADGTTGWVASSSQVEAWCAAVRDYFQTHDPFRSNPATPVAFTKLNDPSWGDGDLRATDDYTQSTDDVAVAAAIAGDTQTMWGSAKPCFHAEFGGDVDSGATQPTHLHNGTWAGTSAGAAMTPLVWCDGGSFPMLTSDMQDHLQYLAQFMEGIEQTLLGKEGLAHASLSIDDSDCRAWGMQLDDQGFAWIQNTNGTMGGQYLTVSNLPAGTYSVLWYDVWTSGAETCHTDTVSVGTDGDLVAQVPSLDQSDIAVKFAAQPTQAVVSTFRASGAGGRAVLTWDTASEVGTAGFYVLRRHPATGQASRVGGRLLTALPHRPQGRSYRIVDTDAEPGETYTYVLVEVEAAGRRRTCATRQVTVSQGHRAPKAQITASARTGRADGARSRPAAARPRSHLRRTMRPRPAAHRRRPWRPWARQAVKIGVREDGLCYVAAAELAPLLGGSPQALGRLLDRGLLSLSCRGRPVAYLPAPGGVGLYFYGQGLDSVYTDENVYWLERGRGVTMAEAEGSSIEPVAEPQQFLHRVHAEEDRWPATGLFRDPEADFWLWGYVVSGQEGASRQSFPLRAPGAVPRGPATLTVHLMGATSTQAEPDHHARIFLNDTPLGETRWDGLEAHSVKLPVPPGLLRPGENTVTVEGLLDTGAAYSIFYLDSIDLLYPRSYVAEDDRLCCRAAGHEVLTVRGFSGPAILVLDITEPDRPVLLGETSVEEEPDGSYSATFAPLRPDGLYLAATEDAAGRPARLVADEPSHLRHRANAADYVVIAPAPLMEPAQALVAHRRRHGLAATAVALEDVYDEFNHGIASPRAIQAFLGTASRTWRRKPRYAVLAGSGTYDYKDHLGYGGNLVPPLLAGTGYGLFAADPLFAPHLAVGRLPAATPEELELLVRKIIAYEQGGGAWTRRVVMAADDPDGGGQYPRDSRELMALVPPAYGVTEVSLETTPVGEARQQLLEAINDGALLVNYLGHGAPDSLAHERLLTIDDLGALENGGRMPVVTTLTCLTGRFAVPGHACLGEALVLRGDGGAIAFWGPSGLLFNRQSVALGKEFLKALFHSRDRRLGDAVTRALRTCGQGGSQEAPLELYNLLGDPALKVRLPR